MAKIADMVTVNGSDINGGVAVGSIEDNANHPSNRLPSPGFGPTMVHSTAMAGSVLAEGNICKAQAMK